MGYKNNFLAAVVGLACLTAASAFAAAPDKVAAPANPMLQKYDTKLPVEISSDNLEVFQHENKAIFKGNVIAVQGKIRLNADTMIVHYRQKTDAEKAAAKPAAPAAAPAPSQDRGEMGAITLIEVEGNVLVATPEESAKGEKGNYQVDEKLLHLTGDNVLLTRGKNILRGTELIYNMETGRSVLTNKGAKIGGTNGGRVRGVFVPNEEDKGKGAAKDKDKDKAKTKAPAPPAP